MDTSLTAPLPAHPRRTAQELWRHALATLAICGAITALLSVTNHSLWDINLAYSLGIGTISWLTIDLGRLWWGRHNGLRWPSGWRAIVLVGAGIANGFVFGSLIGRWYATGGNPSLLPWTPETFWHPLLLTVGSTIVICTGFYLQGKASHLERHVAEARREAAEARLTLLRAQLDPHMLFNTLANLQALIALDPPRAQAMVNHLTQYLRATLDGSRGPEHTLRDEFSLLNDYLELMAIRMGPRLRHQLDLPEALADATLPPLLLQPLVENAIHHGLEPCVAGGLIRVQARWLDDKSGGPGRLELSVHDDGQGLRGDTGLTASARNASAGHTSRSRASSGAVAGHDLNPGTTATSGPASGSFGLAQIRERLARRYGSQASLELCSPAEGGTTARITLPWTAP